MGASLISVLANGAKTSQDVAQQQAQIQGQQQQTANAQIAGQGQQIQNQTELLKQQQMQRQLRDEEITRGIFSDAGKAALPQSSPQVGPNGQPIQGAQTASPSIAPNLLSDPRSAAMEFAKRGGSGAGTIGLLNGLTAGNLELQKLTKGELDNHLAHTQIAANLLEGIANSAPDVRAQAYPAAYAEAVQHAPSLAKFLPAPTPGTAPTDEQLAPAIGFVGLTGNLAKLHQTNAETAQKIQDAATSKANQANLEAQNPGLAAESKIKTLQADATANMKPGDIDARVAQAIDPDKYPEEYQRTLSGAKSALAGGLGPKGVQDAIKDGGDRIGRLQAGIAQAQATAPTKVSIFNQERAIDDKLKTGSLTDDDIKRAGQEYALTGKMPSLGMGSASARAKIQHAKEDYARENGLSPTDIATAQAAFSGDSQSLKKLQSNRDQIVSFENTASKNLDQFLGLAAKIPDTGVPWLNTPIRNLSANIVGSESMAAINAARNVANNEIAKVTSGGGLGGVLSDSARKEVSDYNPQSATLKQTIAVAKVLKQDMANRHGSLDGMIGEIKNRMSGGGTTPSSTKQVEKWGFDSTGKLVKQ